MRCPRCKKIELKRLHEDSEKIVLSCPSCRGGLKIPKKEFGKKLEGGGIVKKE